MIIDSNLMKILDLETITLLEDIDESAFQEGLKLLQINEKLKFDVELLKLNLFFYYDFEKIKVLHLPEDLKELIILSNKIKYIESNPKKFKTDFSKILFSKLTDFRLILTLFADKVNKMSAFSQDKEFLRLIEEIYLPLSHVIGINYYIAQFEDFVIRTKYAYEYHELINKAKKSMLRDSSEIDHLISVLENYRKYPNELITGRIKSPYSVFKKVYVRNEPLENITDYVALRIITKNEDDCYSWMGHIFANWTPVIGKIKDYIEHPKPNGYKSLHATVLTELGPVEFQIRTERMHEFAEFGVAAHWRYKKIASFEISDKVKNKTNANVHDFNLGVEKIFVYTPNGDVVVLDKNSCVLDFAYAIHTEIGNHAVRALVNNQLAPLDQKLEDYDVIEIFTDKNKKPARDWLEFVFSKKSIDKIKQTLGIATKFRREQKIHDKKISELLQKTSVANCCNPFSDDELGLFKTSKRKYVLHSLDCLLKNNKKYELAPEGIEEKLLRKKIIIEIDSNVHQTIVSELKRKLDFENIIISNNEIQLTVKLPSRKDWNNLREKLLNIEGIISVRLY